MQEDIGTFLLKDGGYKERIDMKRKLRLEPPFFEIGPKNYLYGQDIVDLAKAADEAARKYDVRVIYTTPYADIRAVASQTRNLYVFAPHMDCVPVGRGLANVLPESLCAAGAVGVMLNHAERPLTVNGLHATLARARALSMMTIVCADSMDETRAIAAMKPDMMVTEPTELIGTGKAAGTDYVRSSMEAVLEVSPDTGVLVGGGVSSGADVFRIIDAGADATGSSSGIVKAADPERMVWEMIAAAREAWDGRVSRKEAW